MNGNDYNPFEEHNDDYLFRTVTGTGRRKTYSWSLAAMICGIISVICCTGYVGIILGILAVVFAGISRKNLGYFDGMSIAGLVLGIIGFVLSVALIIASFSVDSSFYEEYFEEFWTEYEKQFPTEDSSGSGV